MFVSQYSYNGLRVFLTFFSIVLPWHSGLARTVAYDQTGNATRFTVRTHQVRFTIRHPLRSFVGETRGLNGHLRIDPKDLASGAESRFEISVDSFEMSVPKLRSEFKSLLKAEEHQFIRGQSSFLEFEKPRTGRNLNFSLNTELRVAGAATYPDIHFKCIVEEPVLICKVEGEVSFSALEIKPPKRFGLAVDDKIQITGTVSFAPEA